VLTNLFINLAGVIIFLFLFWKKLREDYTGNQIFSTAVLALTGIGLGFLISLKFFPLGWFWLEFILALLGFTLGIVKFNLRPFELIEAAVVSLAPWLSLIFLSDSVVKINLSSFLAFFSVVCLTTFYIFLDSHYKNFGWYASGRIGFSGLATLGSFFLLRAILAYFFPFVISFIGRLEVIVSGVGAFISFLTLYNLSRRD
jgi:hypothetical protein